MSWWRYACWASLVFVTGACTNFSCSIGKKAEVEVDCRRSSDSYDCAVRHVSGSGKANTCFTIHVQCDNGVNPRANACQAVTPGKTEHVMVPFASIKDFGRCGNATGMKIEELKITVE